MTTEFHVKMKKRRWWHKPQTVQVEAHGYYISDVDSSGFARLVLFKNDVDGRRKQHQFACNALDVDWMLLYPMS